MRILQVILPLLTGFVTQVHLVQIYDYLNALGYYPSSYNQYLDSLVQYSSSYDFGTRIRRNIYKYPNWNQQGARGGRRRNKKRHGHMHRDTGVHSTVPMFANGRQTFTSLRSSCLYAHNKLRALHGVPGLSWDESLAASSRQWARRQAAQGYLYHSPGCLAGEYGENLAYRSLSFKGIWSPAYLIYNLYSELWDPGYNFNYPDSNRGTGHFTQSWGLDGQMKCKCGAPTSATYNNNACACMVISQSQTSLNVVWRSTRKIGCGIATKSYNRVGKMTYIVCQYYPKGNIMGQFSRNVPRPIRGRSMPSSGKSLAVEGCSDYSAYCRHMKKSCSYQREVREACCDSCRWSFNG